jgi:hypothetical protein
MHKPVFWAGGSFFDSRIQIGTVFAFSGQQLFALIINQASNAK